MTADVTYCARHPQVETGLTCGRCGTPICPRCLVQTPVGARCPECANVRRLPTVDVKPVYLLRGLAGALAAGLVAGAAWGWLTGGAGFGLGFLTIFIAMGIGWCVSEAISLATNRKRGTALQACAVVGVAVAYLVQDAVGDASLLSTGTFSRGDAWDLVAAGIAIVFAVSRLSR